MCFKVVWLKEVMLIRGPQVVYWWCYKVLFSVEVVSLERESRKCELRPVTEERTKTGKWIKSRID